MDMWAVAQMLTWKTLLLRCWSKASLVGGIISMSLVFCENNLFRTRSNIIVFIWFIWVQPTDKVCCHFFQPWQCLEWSVDNSCINVQQDRLPLNLKEEVLSDPVNAGIRAMALHVVVPKFVAIVFREVILVVIPTLKEIQISAAGFRALMWWKLQRRITTTSVSPVYIIPSDEDWRAWRRCTKTRVSASSWLHWSTGGLFPTWWTWSPAVM